MMKWRKETQVYMFAHYYSEDGKWKAWDEETRIKSNRQKYNPVTKKFEQIEVWKHYWKLQNLLTGETLSDEFKTLKAAKEYAENQKEVK